MAIEYLLYLGIDQNPEQTLELMFDGLGIEARLERSKPGVFLSTSGPGFTTYSFRTGDELCSILMEELGIESSISILFRLNKFEDLELQKNVLLRATVWLLQQFMGDAALLFNGEVVWLLRKEGQLTLNSGMNLWSPALLALVTIPYEMKDIPTL